MKEAQPTRTAEIERIKSWQESRRGFSYGKDIEFLLSELEASESREKRVREAAEIALRQWMVNYALCAEDDIETAQHLEGQMYRAARRALEGE